MRISYPSHIGTKMSLRSVCRLYDEAHRSLNQANPYEIKTRALARNHIWPPLSLATIKLSDAIVSGFRAPFVQLFFPNHQRQKKTNRVLVHRIHYSFSLSTSLRAGAPVISICYYHNAHQTFFSVVLFFIFTFTIQPCLLFALAIPSPVVSNACRHWYLLPNKRTNPFRSSTRSDD